MPRSKVTFKETVLDLELENVEVTVGPEILRVGRLKAKLDVADLLRADLPEFALGPATGVMLLGFGEKKIMCIKEVRGLTGWSLKEAKDFVESAPNFLDREILLTTAFEAAKTIEAAGGSAKVQRSSARTVLDRLRELLSEAIKAQV